MRALASQGESRLYRSQHDPLPLGRTPANSPGGFPRLTGSVLLLLRAQHRSKLQHREASLPAGPWLGPTFQVPVTLG